MRCMMEILARVRRLKTMIEKEQGFPCYRVFGWHVSECMTMMSVRSVIVGERGHQYIKPSPAMNQRLLRISSRCRSDANDLLFSRILGATSVRIRIHTRPFYMQSIQPLYAWRTCKITPLPAVAIVLNLAMSICGKRDVLPAGEQFPSLASSQTEPKRWFPFAHGTERFDPTYSTSNEKHASSDRHAYGAPYPITFQFRPSPNYPGKKAHQSLTACSLSLRV